MNVGSGSHFGGTSEKNTHLAGANLSEQLLFLDLRVGVVNKGNLLCRNAPGNQFGANVIVNGEGSIFLRRECSGFQRVARNDRLFRFRRSLGCGNIAEHKLGQFVRFAILPDLQNVVHTQIDLAACLIQEVRVDDPLVKSQLPPIRGHFQHIVNGGVYAAGVDSGGSLRKLLHQSLLNLCGLGNYIVVFHLRDREMELIRCLDVCHFLEQIHQLRQIKEPAEPCPGTVAFSFRGQLQSGDGFSKSGSPAVEVGHVHFFQTGILQIPLHGV